MRLIDKIPSFFLSLNFQSRPEINYDLFSLWSGFKCRLCLKKKKVNACWLHYMLEGIDPGQFGWILWSDRLCIIKHFVVKHICNVLTMLFTWFLLSCWDSINNSGERWFIWFTQKHSEQFQEQQLLYRASKILRTVEPWITSPAALTWELYCITDKW